MAADRNAPSRAVREAIYRAAAEIPPGKVATYGDIAEAVGGRCTARGVGWALRNSHPGLNLPWHRVVAAGGRIALPGESGEEQRLRLRGEGVPFAGKHVRIGQCRHAFRPR